MKDKATIKKMIEELKTLKTQDMYLNDFFTPGRNLTMKSPPYSRSPKSFVP
jgi:hypothetical protein